MDIKRELRISFLESESTRHPGYSTAEAIEMETFYPTVYSAPGERPICKCWREDRDPHGCGEPMIWRRQKGILTGGQWTCARVHRERVAAYRARVKVVTE